MRNLTLIFVLLASTIAAQDVIMPEDLPDRQTYCNPIDIDYSYMSHYRARNAVSYRSGADPAAVYYRGKYYLFVTRSHGYWVSEDLTNWKFVKPQSWYFQGCNAPAAAVYKDKLIVYGDPSGRGPVIETDNPELGDWQTNYAVLGLPGGIQDPNLFVDDDNRVYLYEESSNKWPIRGIELDPDNYFIPIGEEVDLFNLDPDNHGWERFGQDHRSDLKPYIEGPWMMKHGGKYYLEYGAPGTQWNVYADGVYMSDHPLGPYSYAPYNPVSYKPGGFLKGSGHGSTVKDEKDQYWHFATMAISVNYKFERRIGMYPAGFELDNGQMYVNTAYGDYPHYAPSQDVNDHKHRFTGWMLLSYNKPVSTNSPLVEKEINVVDESSSGYMLEQITDFSIERLNDEEIRSYWVAEKGMKDVYVQMDLEELMDLKAVQINFQDFNSNIFGRPDTLKQQFTIEASSDGQGWHTIVDFSENQSDHPHAYIELPENTAARYVRYNHIHCSNEYLAMSEFRVFGKARAPAPEAPSHFTVVRQADRRDALLSWEKVPGATGYVIYWGISPDKLNLSALMYEQNSYEVRALNLDQKYFFQVEAFSENGISKRTHTLAVD